MLAPFREVSDKPRCGSGSVNGMLYLPLAWDVAP